MPAWLGGTTQTLAEPPAWGWGTRLLWEPWTPVCPPLLLAPGLPQLPASLGSAKWPRAGGLQEGRPSWIYMLLFLCVIR